MTKILAINPGSTSTKIAVFENNDQIFINIGAWSANGSADITNPGSCIAAEVALANVDINVIPAVVQAITLRSTPCIA